MIKKYVAEHLVDEMILPSTELEAVITVATDKSFTFRRLELEMQKEIRLENIQKEENEIERQKRKEKEEKEGIKGNMKLEWGNES